MKNKNIKKTVCRAGICAVIVSVILTLCAGCELLGFGDEPIAKDDPPCGAPFVYRVWFMGVEKTSGNGELIGGYNSFFDDEMPRIELVVGQSYDIYMWTEEMNGKRFDSWRDNHKCGFDTVADFPNKGHIRAYYDVGFEYDENIMKAEKTDRQWTDGNVSFEAGEVYKIVGLREGETVFTVVDERDYTSIFKSMSVIFSFSSTESCT